MKVDVYNTKGTKAGTAEVADTVFGASFNADLVHQVVISMQANRREGLGRAHAKDRSEVRGGGKKPWRQKGTGRARHGSIRSPLWVGGGVTHGPKKEKMYGKKINKKMRITALYQALSQKLADTEIAFVDSLSFDEPKTREAKALLNSLSGIETLSVLKEKKHNVALIVVPDLTEAFKKSFRNFGNVAVVEARNLNPVDVLSYKVVLVVAPEATSDVLVARMEGKRKGARKAKPEDKKKQTQKGAAPTTETKKKVVKKAKTTTKKTAPKKTAKKAAVKKSKK